MELRGIALKNFKCFNAVRIDCSKFTILTGANSSGKSSLIFSLLGALQTKNFPFFFSPNGNYVNLGDFVEVASDHKKSGSLGIRLEFANSDDNEGSLFFDGTFRLSVKTGLPRLTKLLFGSDAFDLRLSGVGAYQGNYQYRRDNAKEDWRRSDEFREVIKTMLTLSEKAAGARRKRQRETKKKPPSVDQYLKELFEHPAEGRFRLSSKGDLFKQLNDRPILRRQVWDITEYVVEFEKQFNYISSFRLPPERTYLERTKAALKVEKFGENWVEQVVEWEQTGPRQLAKLKSAARRIGLFGDLRSARYSGGRYEMRVTPHANSVESSLADVGFGISQFIPILVADVQLPKASTLAISQPEIHLHPKVQAEFANYLVESNARDRKRYLIETHSEYLLNRFRSLIAQRKLKPEDVAVYYLNRARGHTKCHRLTFGTDGSIVGAPKDFFDTYMMDVMDIAMHASA